jgi:hypothetical protein
MTTLYEMDRAMADFYVPQAIDLLINKCAKHIFTIKPSNDYDDLNKATDCVFNTIGGSIAFRHRGEYAFHEYHDITLRSFRPSGVKTEVEKIREGSPRWYLYCWVKDNKITEWVLLDLNIFRETIIDNPDTPHKKTNYDENKFHAYGIIQLYKAGCITNMSPLVEDYLKSYGIIKRSCLFDGF